jgi:hypothetical protein
LNGSEIQFTLLSIKNRIITLACFAGALTSSAPAADLTSKWQAEFDTQIGRQKYLFDFKVEGDKVAGKAHSDISGEKREAELQEGKLVGDQVAFVELLLVFFRRC